MNNVIVWLSLFYTLAHAGATLAQTALDDVDGVPASIRNVNIGDSAYPHKYEARFRCRNPERSTYLSTETRVAWITPDRGVLDSAGRVRVTGVRHHGRALDSEAVRLLSEAVRPMVEFSGGKLLCSGPFDALLLMGSGNMPRGLSRIYVVVRLLPDGLATVSRYSESMFKVPASSHLPQ